MLSMAMDTQATLALAQGRLDDARSIWNHVADVIGGYAPAAIYEAARGGVWAGDVNAVRTDLARLDATGFHGPVVEVRRTTLQAAVAALEGRTIEALALYRDALHGWSELGIVWDEVLTAIDMATVLDPSEPEVQAAAMAARETLVRLGALPFIERLDVRLAEAEGHDTPAVGVDRREEVLQPGER